MLLIHVLMIFAQYTESGCLHVSRRPWTAATTAEQRRPMPRAA